MVRKRTAFIIGGGITGLSLAEKLKDEFNVIVLEKNNFIGGMCKTHDFKGHKHEFGPHILYAKTDEQKEWWSRYLTNILKDYYVRVSIDGNIDNTYDFPITKSNIDRLIENKPKEELLIHEKKDKEIRSKYAERKDFESFEDYIIYHIGSLGYTYFVKNYNKKQWGIDPKDMGTEWASSRPLTLKDQSPYKMFGEAWAGHPGDYTPLFDKLEEGIEILYNYDVISLDIINETRIQKLIVKAPSQVNENEITTQSIIIAKDDLIFNTSNLDKYVDGVEMAWRGIAKVYCIIDGESEMPDYSTTFPNNYRWTRIMDYKKQGNIGVDGTALISFAIPYGDKKEINKIDITSEIETFITEKLNTKIIDIKFDIQDNIYPVSTDENTENLDKCLKHVCKLNNFYTLGRLGISAYISMSRGIQMSWDLYEWLNLNGFKDPGLEEKLKMTKGLREDLW